jgi:type IV pilus assembly protein PilW
MVAVAGAISIYLANRSSYKLVEGAARVQENARFAMEFMGRDLREAGGIVCGGNLVQENVLTSSQKAEWWSDWSTGLKGYGSSPNNAAEMPTNALAKFVMVLLRPSTADTAPRVSISTVYLKSAMLFP